MVYISANVIGNLMISNERNFSFGRSAYQQPFAQPKPPVQEDTLKTGQLPVERKVFFLALKENARGRFLRISENGGGRRNSIVIPATGLIEFRKLLDEMIEASDELPPK